MLWPTWKRYDPRTEILKKYKHLKKARQLVIHHTAAGGRAKAMRLHQSLLSVEETKKLMVPVELNNVRRPLKNKLGKYMHLNMLEVVDA